MTENPEVKDGYTPIANELMEAFSRLSLTQYEFRVLIVVLRKTYGWSKKEDCLSLSQISEISGIKKPHVSRALTLLRQRNIVTPRGNKIGLNKYWSQWKELPNGVTNHSALPNGVTGVTPRGNKSLPNGAPQKKENNITKTILRPAPRTAKKKIPKQEHLVPLLIFTLLLKKRFDSPAEIGAWIARHARASKSLLAYSGEKIARACTYAIADSKANGYDVALETVLKKCTVIETKKLHPDTEARAMDALRRAEADDGTLFSSSSPLLNGTPQGSASL